MTLSRAALETCYLQAMVARSGVALSVLSEAELQASIATLLQSHPLNTDVWIFAYGSLIWNPCFRFAQSRVVKLYGWHRHFCLWTPLGRGTPDNPGLVLGLKTGGSCQGVAYRIAAVDVETELLLIWRREMVVGSYIPRWVKVSDNQETKGNTACRKAAAFIINPHHSCYAGNLSRERILQSLATAQGELGKEC